MRTLAMSVRHVIQSLIWSELWLALLAASGLLAGLLWRFGDTAGFQAALSILAIAIVALIATIAVQTALRHGRPDRTKPTNPS
jgi:hypothetical protein